MIPFHTPPACRFMLAGEDTYGAMVINRRLQTAGCCRDFSIILPIFETSVHDSFQPIYREAVRNPPCEDLASRSSTQALIQIRRIEVSLANKGGFGS